MRYDAVAFLESLFQPESDDDVASDRLPAAAPATSPDRILPDLPPEWHFLWDERAAIMEYDAGLPRERAEALALADIFKAMERPGQNLRS